MGDRGVDRDLDQALVRDLILEQFPALGGVNVAPFGGGWDNEVFAVGQEWLFRFPKRAEVVPWLYREIALMEPVGQALGTLVPRFEHLGVPSGRFPYPFVGYRRLPGIGADQRPPPDLAASVGLAEDLAAALSAIHRIDPGRVSPTPAGWEHEPWSEHGNDLAAVGHLARSALPASLLGRAEPYLTGQVSEPDQVGPRRFIHNDLCADHVLVDPANGRLAGLIDFNDALVGDPVQDFAGLITIGGAAFIDEVASRYELPVGETFGAQLAWLVRVHTLRWLAEAVAADAPAIPKHLTWVERAFDT